MENFISRSYLFVPANRPERFDKACATNADVVIIDLEDAVPASEKESARKALKAWLSPEKSVLVRINSADSEWFSEDLSLCKMPGIAGIVLPKAERIDDLAVIAHAGAEIILPLIESAHGISNVNALARSPRVQRLLFGSIDFSLDLGITEGHQELLYFRSTLVLASRVAGIQAPVDGVTTSIDDIDAIRNDTQQARRLGFGGKLCIHPKQVNYVNEGFDPSATELSWAKRVLEAASTANGAAVAIDGKMVDRPVMLLAQRILSDAERRSRPQKNT
ncbi:CoA ester lyase [Glaciimonas sp. Gout2]|uniref:HpcH/HpaI aldolase/citrate lyase family protein n=1 Tax=unclassified Glaciimonas TaxID=2644401 RepID=UPI002B230DF7|nr:MULTISPECIES: CoA ester lyase [unclassified Glaciimonas]MEB0010195.1 CoA ester lyase [Glaciimonas sp. Cout2]MEB0084300.1 CoA ester lyase [Glaciimonas sp. Gout2]